MRRRKDTQLQQDIKVVYDYVMLHRPIVVDSIEEVAQAIDLPYERVHAVFFEVRKPEWIEANHWTIPYLDKGRKQKTLTIANTLGEREEARHGLRVHANEVATRLDREVAQVNWIYSLLPNKRSAEAKLAKRLLLHAETAAVNARDLAESLAASEGDGSAEAATG